MNAMQIDGPWNRPRGPMNLHGMYKVRVLRVNCLPYPRSGHNISNERDGNIFTYGILG
jgi:hypothetical protein